MKKLMVFAMAAMVALASCTKTELVDNSAPQEIGFKAVTKSVTKAPVMSTSAFTQSLGVVSYLNSDKSLYFSNAEFESTTETITPAQGETPAVTETTWQGGKYWPIVSKLDFMVYSPYLTSGVTATNNNTTDNTTKSLAVTITDNSADKIDYMYGSAYISEKSKEKVSVTLNHALALITVNFACDDAVTLTDAVLTSTYNEGTYTVTYGDETTLSWNTNGINPKNLKLYTTDESGTTTFGNQYMVVPSQGTSIKFSYNLEGMDDDADDLTYTIDLTNGKWEAGYHYNYKVMVTANAIKFVPDVSGWEGGEETTL